jgi:hypothetical protein
LLHTPYFILLTHCCLLRGSFRGKEAVGGMSPFPVADSPETTPPSLGLKQSLVAANDLHFNKSFKHTLPGIARQNNRKFHHLAYSTALVSRITVTLICPG